MISWKFLDISVQFMLTFSIKFKGQPPISNKGQSKIL